MRIGVDVCCWSNRRGFGRFTRELMKALAAIDGDNEYFFFADRETASAIEVDGRVNIVVAPTRVSPTRAASAQGRRSLGDLWAMARTVRKTELDLFFFPAVYSYFPVINRNVKIILTIHDVIAEQYPGLIFPDRRYMLFWKMKVFLARRQAHLVLTVSEHSRRQIVDHFKMPESRVLAITEGPEKTFRVLHCGGEMNDTLHRYRLDPGKRMILYVGGISPHKNLSALVDAFFALSKKPGYSDVRLLLVGDLQGDSFHTNHAEVAERISALGLEDKVMFTGFVPDQDLVVLYNAATFLVLPSFQEGFGLPAVEAMACGTPVAAAGAGSLPEVIGNAGRFFDPHSRAEMLRVFEKILSDDTLRDELSRLAVIRARQYSWEKAAEKTRLIFNALAHGDGYRKRRTSS